MSNTMSHRGFINKTANQIRRGPRRAAKSISDSELGRLYGDAVTPGAMSAQDALVALIGASPVEGDSVSLRQHLGRMAGNEAVLNLIRSLPAAAVVGGGVAAGDLIAGEESFANKGMDILGMGAGAYGINRGVNGMGGTTPAGRALAIAAGLGIGKFGSDAVQGGIGGIM